MGIKDKERAESVVSRATVMNGGAMDTLLTGIVMTGGAMDMLLTTLTGGAMDILLTS